jgi:hypothetical protein
MPEFIDNLGAPGDYQRPTGGSGGPVDIFGQVADLFTSATRAPSTGSDDTLTKMKQIRDLKTDKALDMMSVAATAFKTGATTAFEQVWGDDAKPYLDKMAQITELRKNGEMSATEHDVLFTSALTSLQAAYPEAGDELGKWMIENKVDHTVGREWLERQKILEGDLDVYRQERGENLRVGLVNKGATEMTEAELINLGAKIRYGEETLKRETALLQQNQVELANAKSLSDADKARIEERTKQMGNQVVATIIGQGGVAMSRILSDMAALSGTIIENDFNTEMSQGFIEAVPSWLNEVNSFEAASLQAGRTIGLTEDQLQPIKDEAEKVRKQINEWATGDTSVAKMQLQQVNTLMSKYQLEGGEALAAFTALQKGLGTELTTQLFNGTLPNFGAADISAIRDQMVRWASGKNVDVREAHEKFLNFQAALNSPDIPADASPEVRAENIRAKAVGLASATETINSNKAPSSAKTFKMFNASLKGILNLSLQESGPTMSVNSVTRIVGTAFTPAARNAWRESQKVMGASVKDWTDTGNYSAIVAADLLDGIKQGYGERAPYNPQTGRFEAVKMPRGGANPMGGALGGAGGFAPGGPGFGGKEVLTASDEDRAIATQMNILLDHLEYMDKELGFVPEGALKGTGPDAEKMTTREIFATDEGLAKSIDNWINSASDPVAETSKAEFFKVLDRVKKGDQYPKMNFSNLSPINLMVASQETRTKIRSAPARYMPVNNIEGFRIRMGKTEGGDKITGNQPHNLERSSAAGSYGFLNDYHDKSPIDKGEGTWDANLIEIMPAAAQMTAKQRYDLMADPVIEDAVFDHFTNKNARAMSSALGRQPSWDELDIAHLLGAGGAADFIKAFTKNPMAPAASIVGNKAAAANPELMGGTLLQLWNKRLRREDKNYQAYIESTLGIKDAPVPSVNHIVGLESSVLADTDGPYDLTR